jgi:tripeptide aminopeptidase
MRALRRTPAYSRVTDLAEQRGVHQAFQWLHLHEPQFMQWQTELVSIPAPPFGERPRAEWLAARFRELALTEVEIDAAGNALGVYSSGEKTPRCILISAHIDTVFPLSTPIHPIQKGTRLAAPGACDNGAGVVALLALALALRHAAIETPCDLLFAGNVGEEGEGDLRGIRYLYQQHRDRIAAHIILDGAGHELAVTAAVGSRRFSVTIEGPGGHSWSDAGRPNPIVAMSQAIARLAQLQLPEDTHWNVGAIEGGTSVNSIPQAAAARFDLRSTDSGREREPGIRQQTATED